MKKQATIGAAIGVLACLAAGASSARADVPDALEAGGIPVELDGLHGFSDEQTDKAKQAAALMSGVLGSEAFREAVLRFAYDGQPGFSNNSLADASGATVMQDMTSQQIYDTLMATRETYLSNTDGEAHLDLTMWTPSIFRKWNVVGYGYPGQPQIFLNINWFDTYTPAQVAGNIAHEWTHKLGFDHDYKATERRPYSVPYGVGCIVEQLAGGASAASCPAGQVSALEE